MSSKPKPCVGCPFNDGVTEEATMAQNLGCLPTSGDMIRRFDGHGDAHSCHENDKKACRGLAMHRNVEGVKVMPYSVWYQNGGD